MRCSFILFIALALCTSLHGQLTIEVTIVDGNSSSDCGDLIGAPDHIWSVRIEGQDWVTYGNTDLCTYESFPNLQYTEGFSCPIEVREIEVCFRAFENDPSIFDPCAIDASTCFEEICEQYTIEPTMHTLSIPNSRSAAGQVQFEISTTGSFIGDINDLPCLATDLGQLGASGQVGDATLSSFNNYCGTKTAGEPDPGDFFAPWRNNVGVWFSFTTANEPIHRLQVHGTSDPENLGDPLQLQVGLFLADDCAGTFTYLGGSGPSNIDTDFDEFFEIDCGPELQANSTYYIVVDGVDDTPEQKNGIFGLEVTAIPLVPNEIEATLCFGEVLEFLGLRYDASGMFQDTVSLPSGCDTIIHANIRVLEELVLTVNQLSEATNEGANDGVARASAVGGAGNFSFLWSDGSTDPTNANLVGGETASVTVTDANGCMMSESFEVDFIHPIMPTIIEDTLACFGDMNGRLSISATEGKPPYTLMWEDSRGERSGEGILRSENEIITLDNLPAGTYSITLSDNISADVVLSAEVSQPDELQLNIIENRAASCFSFCDGRLELQLEGGTLPYNFDFSRGSFDLIAFTDLCAGDFDLTITDANNCVDLFTIPIEEPEEFIATAEVQDVACFGAMDGTISISTNGDPIAYTWDNGSTSPNLIDLDEGMYSLTVTNSDNCQDTLSVTIEQPDAPLETQIAVLQTISCFNAADGILSTTSNEPTAGLSYSWSTGQNTASIETLGPATYSVSVENANGCIASDSISLTQPDELLLDAFSTQNIGCTEALQVGYVQVDEVSGGTMPYEYSLDGIRFTPQTRLDGLREGAYTLIVQDTQGCEVDVTFAIQPRPDLQVSLGPDRSIALGEELELEALSNFDNLEYTWRGIDSLKCTPCPNNLSFVPTGMATYYVDVFDPATECTATDAVTIAVSREQDLYLPTAFSPNGDGVNDFFTIFAGPSIARVLRIQIFNRRGHLVYGVENPVFNTLNVGWDGRFHGKFMNPDVFAYIVEVEYIDGSKDTVAGDLSLVR